MKNPCDYRGSFRVVQEKRLHLTVKSVLTLCAIPIAFVDEVITFAEIVEDFDRSCDEWRRRGCIACGEELRDALTNAERIS